jgi:hypothetical protein
MLPYVILPTLKQKFHFNAGIPTLIPKFLTYAAFPAAHNKSHFLTLYPISRTSIGTRGHCLGTFNTGNFPPSFKM